MAFIVSNFSSQLAAKKASELQKKKRKMSQKKKKRKKRRRRWTQKRNVRMEKKERKRERGKVNNFFTRKMIKQGYKNLYFKFSVNSHRTWLHLQHSDSVDEL